MSSDNTATYSEVNITDKKKSCLASRKKGDQSEIPECSNIPMYSEINQVSETSAPRNADTAFDNQVYSMDTSDNTLNRTVEQSHQADPATPQDNVLGTKTAFDNQVYSMGTSDNTYSMLNRTVEQSHQADPATPQDNVLGTKTAFDNQVYSMGTSDNTYSKLNRTVEQSRQANPATPHDNVLGTKTAPHKEKSKKDQCERNLVWIVISVNILLLLAVGVLAVAALVQVSKLNSEIVSLRASLHLALPDYSDLNDEIVSLRASLSNSSASLNEEIVSHRASLYLEVSNLNDEIVSIGDFSAVLSQNFSILENETQIHFDGLDSRMDDLYTMYLTGRNSDNPATSCSHILQLNSPSPSGHYWIRSSNGSAKHVYCDMTRSCGGVTGGWMRVVSLNWSNESLPCPDGFIERGHLNIRTCGIGSRLIGSCSSLIFETYRTVYSRVCGKINAYQVGNTDAFGAHGRGSSIDSNYVDGVSLTHGSNPRRHIWTFAAAVNDDPSSSHSGSLCQCVRPGDRSIMPLPSFVGMDYFCDTGSRSGAHDGQFYPDDPLWDGAGCASTSMCCSFNNPPWFHKQLPSATTDDIEMRVCCDERGFDEDIALSSVELYVQ